MARNRRRNRNGGRTETATVSNQAEERGAWWLERGPGGTDSFAGLASLYGPASIAPAGVIVNEETALTLSAFYACVNLVASDIAALPVSVHERRGTGSVPVDHYLNELLDFEVNEYVDAFNFEQSSVSSLMIHGNATAEIERDPETLKVEAIWPIPWLKIQPQIFPGSRLYYRLTGGDDNQGESYLLPEDVLHVKAFSDAGLVGISPIQKARVSLGIAVAADATAAAFYGNGSRADGFLKYNGTLKPDERKKFREEFYADHGGPYRSNRIGFLGGDWSFVQTSISPADAQMIEVRKASALDACRWLNVFPVMIGIDDNTGMTYQDANLFHVTRTLRPISENIELEWSRKLLTRDEIRRGLWIKHDFGSRMRGNIEALSDMAAKLFPNCSITPNEIRALFDLPPTEHGTQFYIATNNLAPVDQVGRVPQQTVPGDVAEPQDEGDSTNEEAS